MPSSMFPVDDRLPFTNFFTLAISRNMLAAMLLYWVQATAGRVQSAHGVYRLSTYVAVSRKVAKDEHTSTSALDDNCCR